MPRSFESFLLTTIVFEYNVLVFSNVSAIDNGGFVTVNKGDKGGKCQVGK